VHQIQSLHPEGLAAHMNLYKAIMFGRSPLKRYQREMIAVVVSAANKCAYCVAHHKEALNFYWKDRARCDALGEDHAQVDLSPLDRAICEHAETLTSQPQAVDDERVDHLRKLGLSDRAILDVSQIVAYFNFVNRLVLGLGVEVDEGEVKGYTY
jgi:uncharacterized peroxidase-related enzyme